MLGTKQPHPSQTPEYWRGLAKSERAFAAAKRGDRHSSVESVRIHLKNAEDYEATAAALEQKTAGSAA